MSSPRSAAMPPPASSTELLELLRKSDVVPSSILRAFLERHSPLPEDARDAARYLVQHELITTFQAKLLLVGRYRGFRLGNYRLLDQIGQGGMGAVYLAEHESHGTRAAIKVLPPGGNKLAVERFLREARSAAALDHTNIVKLFESGLDGNVHFLVMEYVQGRTLDRIVEEEGPLPAEQAVAYVLQAAAALQHAHEKGFIHRDIKPSNLIVSSDGVLKILDMGLARSSAQTDLLTDMLDAGAVVGTADFISPEQASNAHDIDIRTDIYSLGASVFSLVAGRPPFEGTVANKLLQHQIDTPPLLSELVPDFPERLAQIVARTLSKQPDQRYQTPAELIRTLESWQKSPHDDPVPPTAARDGEKPRKGSLRWRSRGGAAASSPSGRANPVLFRVLLVAIGVLFLAALAVAVALFLLPSHSARSLEPRPDSFSILDPDLVFSVRLSSS